MYIYLYGFDNLTSEGYECSADTQDSSLNPSYFEILCIFQFLSDKRKEFKKKKQKRFLARMRSEELRDFRITSETEFLKI